MQPGIAPLPKYLQVSENLTREVAAGHLRPGDRLPPEREMARQEGIAVGTLRRALQELARRGLVERRHGSGNYIAGRPVEPGIYAFFRLERPEGGGLPRAALISLQRLAKPGWLPAFGQSREATRLRRVRYLDKDPVAVEEIWLDGKYCIDAARLVSESLYLHYRSSLGLQIVSVLDKVGLGEIPEWSAELPAHMQCGLIQRASFTQKNECPEISFTWFDAKRAWYIARTREADLLT